MEQRVDLVTLGVHDLAAVRRFYLDGLGWTPALDLPGEILFLQVNHGLLLALMSDVELEHDVLGLEPSPARGFGNLTFAHNVPSEADVDAVVARAERAGGLLLKPPQLAAFGGYHAYVADPAGLRWEIACNPGWSVGADGVVRIAPLSEPRP